MGTSCVHDWCAITPVFPELKGLSRSGAGILIHSLGLGAAYLRLQRFRRWWDKACWPKPFVSLRMNGRCCLRPSPQSSAREHERHKSLITGLEARCARELSCHGHSAGKMRAACLLASVRRTERSARKWKPPKHAASSVTYPQLLPQ